MGVVRAGIYFERLRMTEDRDTSISRGAWSFSERAGHCIVDPVFLSLADLSARDYGIAAECSLSVCVCLCRVNH